MLSSRLNSLRGCLFRDIPVFIFIKITQYLGELSAYFSVFKLFLPFNLYFKSKKHTLDHYLSHNSSIYTSVISLNK